MTGSRSCSTPGPALLRLEARDDEVMIVAADHSGLLGIATGALALHRVDVRSAAVFARGELGAIVCRVAPRFGELPDWTVVRDDLRRALAGEFDLDRTLQAREAAYAGRPRLTAPADDPAGRRRLGERHRAGGARS